MRSSLALVALLAAAAVLGGCQLADDLSSWLAAPKALREATREAIVAATREHYSWDGVARSVIAAARGELDGLPLPAPDIGASG